MKCNSLLKITQFSSCHIDMSKTRFQLVFIFSVLIQFALIPNGALSSPEEPDNVSISLEPAGSIVRTIPQNPNDTIPPPGDHIAWKNDYKGYLERFNKSLDRNHLEIYRARRTDVFHQNNDGKNTWKKAINIFTDMTEEEVKDHMGYTGELHKRPMRYTSSINAAQHPSDLLQSLDYRRKKIVSSVKDQGDCGCCFAFATVSVVESKYAMLNVTIDLSEQHIVDCANKNVNGCNGGSFRDALEFMENVGLETESNNNYKALGNQSCRAPGKKYDYQVINWTEVNQNETDMMTALRDYGPIAASLFVDTDFRSYAGGIFDGGLDGNAVPNHAVVIVGYGRVHETDVWYVKNSWGEKWGQGGFMTLKRNVNLRGIADGAFAIVNVAEDNDSALQSGFFSWAFFWSTVAVVIGCILITLCILYFKRTKKSGSFSPNRRDPSPDRQVSGTLMRPLSPETPYLSQDGGSSADSGDTLESDSYSKTRGSRHRKNNCKGS